jgi:hypothetical protein
MSVKEKVKRGEMTAHEAIRVLHNKVVKDIHESPRDMTTRDCAFELVYLQSTNTYKWLVGRARERR